MECKFCGTHFNAHSCPNCGGAAHQPPQREAPGAAAEDENRQPATQGPAARRPVAHPSPHKRYGAMIIRFALAVAIPLLVLAFLPRLLFSGLGGSGRANSAPGASASAIAPASEVASEAQGLAVDPNEGTVAFQTLPEDSYKSQAAAMDFDDVKRNPGMYTGSDMYVTFEISQADENPETGNVRYIGYVQNADGTIPDWETRSDRRVVVYDREHTGARYYKGERITVYGDFTGIDELQGAMFGSFHMPAFNARYIELQEEEAPAGQQAVEEELPPGEAVEETVEEPEETGEQ